MHHGRVLFRVFFGAVALAPFVLLLIAMITGRAHVSSCCAVDAGLKDEAVRALPVGLSEHAARRQHHTSS